MDNWEKRENHTTTNLPRQKLLTFNILLHVDEPCVYFSLLVVSSTAIRGVFTRNTQLVSTDICVILYLYRVQV